MKTTHLFYGITVFFSCHTYLARVDCGHIPSSPSRRHADSKTTRIHRKAFRATKKEKLSLLYRECEKTQANH